MLRVLIAARLSQKQADGQEGIGLATQDKRAKAWALREGHEVVAVAADTRKGTVAPWDRPNLKPWVTEPALMASYDGIVAYKNDRLSRGVWADEVRIRLWAEEHGKVLMIVDGPQWPPRHDGDKWSWEAQASQARKEWEEGRERTMRATGEIRDRGFLVGYVPYGFTITGEKYSRMMAPDPVEAAFIIEAIRRYLAGDSLRVVCAWLDEAESVPRHGGLWSPVTLSRVFRNESLIGRRTDAAGRTVLKHEPILDRGTWDRLQAELDRKKGRKGVAPSGSALLTGVAVCANCGGPMYRHISGQPASRRHYYRCSGTDREPSTCRNMVLLAELDSWLDHEVASFPGKVVEAIELPAEPHDDAIADVRRDIAELDPEAGDYDERLAALRAELARLRALPAGETTGAVAVYRVADLWAKLDRDQRRHYLISAGITVKARKGNFRLVGDLSEFRHSGWPGLESPDTDAPLLSGADALAYLEAVEKKAKNGVNKAI